MAVPSDPNTRALMRTDANRTIAVSREPFMANRLTRRGMLHAAGFSGVGVWLGTASVRGDRERAMAGMSIELRHRFHVLVSR